MNHSTYERYDTESSATAGLLVPAARGTSATRGSFGQLNYADGMGPSVQEEPSDLGVDLAEYLRILRKRMWLIVGSGAAFLALGTTYTLMQTPLYTATVRLQIDQGGVEVLKEGNVAGRVGSSTEFLRTQYQILKSRAIAERVTSLLNLGNNADFLRPRSFSIGRSISNLLSAGSAKSASASSKTALDQRATTLVKRNVAVRPVRGSRLVDITYTDAVPAQARRIVMAIASAYMASNIDKRFQANAYSKTFLQDKAKQLKLRLVASEKALLAFAQREKIVAVTNKASIAENNLASANVALGALISQRIANEQQWKQVAKAKVINLPQLLTNSVIDGLRANRNTLVTEYQEKLETFKPGYPAMIGINNKIKAIDRQLANEVWTIKASYKAAYESSLSQENEMKKQIVALRKDVLDLQKRSIQYNNLKREVTTNRDLYVSLLQRFKEVDLAGGIGTNNVFIVDKALTPQVPSSPKLGRALLLSLILGLSAGIGGAVLLEILNDTIMTVEGVEEVTGLTTLGVIPKLNEVDEFETAITDPRSALSEAYRSLATSLQFTTQGGLPKSLVTTSAGPSEGKSSTALAIARHFAVLGMKVLLVDADLRKPSLHTKIGVENRIGLSNYLTGSCTPPEAFQNTTLPNLTFMATGPLPPNPADLLASSRLRTLLTVGLEVFDLIVIDGPPVLGLADAQILSSAAAATIFVVGAGQARKAGVRGALKRLEMAHAQIIGAALNKFDAKAAGYGYGYGYGDGYGYGALTYGEAPEAADAAAKQQPQLTDAPGSS